MNELSMLPEIIPAIEEYRKTQTRRVIKPQPIWHPKKRFWALNQIVKGHSFTWEEGLIPNAPIKYCPYGKVDDRACIKGTDIIIEYMDVRIEQVKSISEEDAIAEGCGCQSLHPDDEYISGIEGFEMLFDSIYGAGSFEHNLWVWVIVFELF